MGYEIKLYLGQVSDISFYADKKYFKIYGMVDLCKPGYDSEIIRVDSEAGDLIYFYGTDGNTEIIEDKYGKSLKAVPASTVFKALKKDWEDSKKEYHAYGYRRFYIAVYMLYTFIKSSEEPMVVIYGY